MWLGGGEGCFFCLGVCCVFGSGVGGWGGGGCGGGGGGELNRPGHEADHTLPSGASGAIPPLPPCAFMAYRGE